MLTLKEAQALRQSAKKNYKPVNYVKGAKKEPWWQKTLNFVMRPQRAVTGGLANITDKDRSTTLLGGVLGGISGRERKDFDEVMNNLRWKQREKDEKYNFWQGQKGKFDFFDIVNLAGNIGLDPLTYLTFGGSSILKSGARAQADEAVRQGAKYGLNIGGSKWLKGSAKRMTKDTPDIIETALLKRGRSVEEAAQASKTARVEIDNAGKSKRLRDQNAFINFDVPFTNISKAFGKKPSWLQKHDNLITNTQVEGLANMLSKIAGEAATPDEVSKLISARYGKDDISKLTMQEVNDLQTLKNFSYKADESAPKNFSEQAMGFLGNYKFQQGSGGVSKLGNALRPLNPFNARSVFANKDPLINRSATQFTENRNLLLGRVRQAEKDLENLVKGTKSLSKEEKFAIPYVVEKTFPQQYKNLDDFLMKTVGNTANKKQIENVAEFLKNRHDYYGGLEVTSGLREFSRENYFPHIQDFDAQEAAGIFENVQKYLNDPAIGQFLSQSANNPYAKQRKSFSTLAEVDDAISKLNDTVSKTTPGTKEYEELLEKVTLLKNLFKRDPVEVFEKRSKAAVRSSAMKALLDQYILDGVIQIVPTRKGITKEMSDKGFRLLETREADAIGLLNILAKELKVSKKGKSKNLVVIHKKLFDLLKDSPKFSQREAINRVVEVTNTATNVFKTLYTSLVPKHYFYNFVGNVFNNTMAGVTADSYLKAGKLMYKLRNKTLTAKEQKLIDYALDEGILNQTAFADLVRPEILRKGYRGVEEEYASFYNRIDKTNQKVVDNPVSKKMRQYLGDPSDNLTRLAHYIHVYETTRSVKLASESVRLHLFNYNEVTSSDRLMKVVFPFWNWMKNNIPLQLTKFVTEPRIAAQWQRLQEQSFGDSYSENYPDYIQEGFAKLPWGNQDGEQRFYNPRTPLQDLTQVGDPLKTMLNAITPVAKMPAEFFFNKQVFSGTPVSYEKAKNKDLGYFETDLSADQTQKYLRSNLGILGDIWDLGAQATGAQPRNKDWVDLMTDQIFGSTANIR